MLKLKEGFVLRQVAGEYVVLPSGDELDLNMMITLNGTGAFLWGKIEQGIEESALLAALMEEYDVDEERAKASISAFVAKLRNNGFLAE